MISQKPKFGTVLRGGGKVNLVVSRGRKALVKKLLGILGVLLVVASAGAAGAPGASAPSFARPRSYATGRSPTRSRSAT